MFSIHQNKILHVFKYDLSSLFIERDRKAMQKVLKKEKNVGHMKVPKYRKKGDTMKVSGVFKKKR
jgi:hypothetical protein